MAQGLARLDGVLAKKPAVLVVALGINDALRGQSLDDAERDLTTIVERAQAAGARVVLVGLRIPDAPHGAAYAARFAEIYPRLAAARRLHFVPFLLEGVAGLRDLNFPDGLHPNAAGHARLAQNVARQVELAVAEVGSGLRIVNSTIPRGRDPPSVYRRRGRAGSWPAGSHGPRRGPGPRLRLGLRITTGRSRTTKTKRPLDSRRVLPIAARSRPVSKGPDAGRGCAATARGPPRPRHEPCAEGPDGGVAQDRAQRAQDGDELEPERRGRRTIRTRPSARAPNLQRGQGPRELRDHRGERRSSCSARSSFGERRRTVHGSRMRPRGRWYRGRPSRHEVEDVLVGQQSLASANGATRRRIWSNRSMAS